MFSIILSMQHFIVSYCSVPYQNYVQTPWPKAKEPSQLSTVVHKCGTKLKKTLKKQEVRAASFSKTIQYETDFITGEPDS